MLTTIAWSVRTGAGTVCATAPAASVAATEKATALLRSEFMGRSIYRDTTIIFDGKNVVELSQRYLHIAMLIVAKLHQLPRHFAHLHLHRLGQRRHIRVRQ